jgi:hypothetical protein
MPQEDDGASELDHPEEIFWVVFPANDGTTKVMKPSEQTFHFPPTPVAAQNPAVLRRRCDAHEFVGRDELHAVAFVDALVQWIAVVRAVADHAFRGFSKESLVERGLDELRFMRRSAGHVHGERKTMAVCDGHDFAAFTALCRANTRAPFFAPLKLASMKDSLRSSFPRSRKSSASFCSKRVSNPLRCQCWKRR